MWLLIQPLLVGLTQTPQTQHFDPNLTVKEAVQKPGETFSSRFDGFVQFNLGLKIWFPKFQSTDGQNFGAPSHHFPFLPRETSCHHSAGPRDPGAETTAKTSWEIPKSPA